MQKLNSKWVLSEFTPSCLEIPTCLEMCYIPRAIRKTLIIKKTGLKHTVVMDEAWINLYLAANEEQRE